MADRMNVAKMLPLTHLSFHVMLAIADQPLHGYGIIKEVADRTEGATELEAGTLYAAIKRMNDEGLLEEADPPEAGGDARRRYYRLTGFGREVLEAESRRLANLLRVARDKKVIHA
jgi:DNA-binding PadR family transcriptional regulator